MLNLTSPSWWINQFVSTFITICFIYLIKKAFTKINVPVVSEVVSEA